MVKAVVTWPSGVRITRSLGGSLSGVLQTRAATLPPGITVKSWCAPSNPETFIETCAPSIETYRSSPISLIGLQVTIHMLFPS